MKKKNADNQNNAVTIYLPELSELTKKFDSIADLLEGKKTDVKMNEVIDLLKTCNDSLKQYQFQGLVTGSKFGKKIYYKRSDLDNFLKSNVKGGE